MQTAQQLQYLKVKVETSSPGELTLLLYQELVRSLLKAKQYYEENIFDSGNECLHKSRSILNELIVTLDMKYSISNNLLALYQFYNARITECILQKKGELLDDVIEFAKDMVETWKKALQIIKVGSRAEHA